MFEKVKAITIVRRMVSDSESVINCAKEEGFLTSKSFRFYAHLNSHPLPSRKLLFSFFYDILQHHSITEFYIYNAFH